MRWIAGDHGSFAAVSTRYVDYAYHGDTMLPGTNQPSPGLAYFCTSVLLYFCTYVDTLDTLCTVQSSSPLPTMHCLVLVWIGPACAASARARRRLGFLAPVYWLVGHYQVGYSVRQRTVCRAHELPAGWVGNVGQGGLVEWRSA